MLFRSLVTVVLLLIAYPQRVASQGAPVYADSENGLKQLIEELQGAAGKDDVERFRVLAGPLYFSKHKAWFKEVFGERLGDHASANYAKETGDLVDAMRAAFKKLAQDGYDKPQVERVDKPCSNSVQQDEYPVLFARRKKVPFLRVQYKMDGKFQSLGFFVFADDGFRYLGHIKLEIARELKPVKPAPIKSLKPARLLYRKDPKYPEEARQARIRGVVRLKALIGRDGKVEDLLLETGPCLLVDAAMEAVWQWRYSPLTIGDTPLEVPTTIDVVFTLR